jgi:type II secretory pathway pseudopilin PulG
MFGIEMARPPASTKPMEVKLAHQESELVGLLKRIPLGPAELSILQERAIYLRDGCLRLRGEALLPLMLASYIFESLVTSGNTRVSKVDEHLGFEACVAAIGLKANVSEAEHPLLCEGTRRQRGDLALLLLVHYKDDPERLAKIMEKLLDKDIHTLLKSGPILTSYYVQQPSRSSLNAAFRGLNINQQQRQQLQQQQQQQQQLQQQQQQLQLQQQPQQQPPNEQWVDWEDYLNPQRGAATGGSAAGNRVAMPTSAPATNRSLGTGPGSDSGSSGNSSADSMESSSSSKNARNYPHEDSPEIQNVGAGVSGAGIVAGVQPQPQAGFVPAATGGASVMPTPQMRQPPM